MGAHSQPWAQGPRWLTRCLPPHTPLPRGRRFSQDSLEVWRKGRLQHIWMGEGFGVNTDSAPCWLENRKDQRLLHFYTEHFNSLPRKKHWCEEMREKTRWQKQKGESNKKSCIKSHIVFRLPWCHVWCKMDTCIAIVRILSWCLPVTIHHVIVCVRKQHVYKLHLTVSTTTTN